MDISYLSLSEFSNVMLVHALLLMAMVCFFAQQAAKNPANNGQNTSFLVGWKKQIMLVTAVTFGTLFGYLFFVDNETRQQIKHNRIIPKSVGLLFIVTAIVLPVLDLTILAENAEKWYSTGWDGVIRPAGQTPFLGYETESQYFFHKAIEDFFTSMAIAVYALRFRWSDTRWYTKVRKAAGYLFFYAFILSVGDMHYFDIPEILPRLIFAAAAYFLVKDYNKTTKVEDKKTVAKVNMAVVQKPEKQSAPQIQEEPVSDESKYAGQKKDEKMDSDDMKRFCPYCGKPVYPENIYCSNCGKRLVGHGTAIVPHKAIIAIKSSICSIGRIFYNMANSIAKGFVKCLKGLCTILWNRRKILLYGVAGVVLTIGLGIGSAIYFKEYLPKKRINDAIADINYKFKNSSDSIRLEMAAQLMDRHHKWNYEGVDDYSLFYQNYKLRTEAVEYIRQKAEQGDPRSQYHLGRIYFREEAFEKSAYWWLQAAENGCIDACNLIGQSYRLGKGVKTDMQKAVYWLKKGAEAGEMNAQANYGSLFVEGVKVGSHRETLVPKDIEQAKEWWRKSAAQGCRRGKDYLEKIYE